MRKIIILGATGSVGSQALELISRYPEQFEVVGISAGSNAQKLAQIAIQHKVANTALGATESAELIRTVPSDIVLNAITGSAGLMATLATLETGAKLALANKESLIMGGTLVTKLAKADQILPVDSEHSAIWQALRAGKKSEVAELVLTASGGPFRGFTKQQLTEVSLEQALKHPTWAMGPVITINSASLINKGLEVIEAALLFEMPTSKIRVVVHPQSLVHSMVTFQDGSTIAQASSTDMNLPISLALDFPNRLAGAITPIDWDKAQTWQFEPLDNEVFPAVQLAKQVADAGGVYPAIYNAANEVLVELFQSRKIRFDQIVSTIAEVVELYPASNQLSLENIMAADEWARSAVSPLLTKKS